MRTITVNGRKYKWIVGKSNVKIACPEIRFSHIIPKSEIGETYWDCELGCNRGRKSRETACPHAYEHFLITPKHIRAKIEELSR